MRNKVPVQLSGGVCVFFALALLVLPLKWLLAAVIAAAIHECCHLAAIRLCRGDILSICIGIGGANICMTGMKQEKELICALAGPAGGFLLLLLIRWIPEIALCAAVQSLYNLLPVYPLDGGRALQCAAALVFRPDKADRLCNLIQRGCCAVILILGAWGSIRLKLGNAPLILAAAVLMKSGVIKIPCKRGTKRVQ